MDRKGIALVGMMGCGKTSVGKEVSQLLGYRFIDLDEEIVRLSGKSIPENFASIGEEGFRKLEISCLNQLLSSLSSDCSKGKWLLSCGGGTPVSPQARALLKENCLCIYLDTPAEILSQRLENSTDRPMLDGHGIAERIAELLDRRDAIYRDTAEYILNCSNKNFEDICKETAAIIRHSNYGLIGYPIAHSLSPKLFTAAYGGKYSYELLEYQCFDEAFEAFRKAYEAVNVTAPHKQAALEAADEADEDSVLAEACNILRLENGRIIGRNSDILAVRSLLANCCSIISKSAEALRVLVLGCGGAGRAAITAAEGLGMKIDIYNRTYSKAVEFMTSVEEHRPSAKDRLRTVLALNAGGNVEELTHDGKLRLDAAVEECDVIVYTLPCELPELNELLKNCCEKKIIIEANYRNPQLSGFCGKHHYIDGRQWLIQQAIEGYELMTGEVPERSAIKEII